MSAHGSERSDRSDRGPRSNGRSRRHGGGHIGHIGHSARSRLQACPRGQRAHVARGFTLIELLVVLVLVAIGAGVVSLALRDGAATKLEEEGARLAALLEGARAESRTAGVAVLWIPGRGELPTELSSSGRAGGGNETGPDEGFRFVGLPASVNMPRHWLEPRVTAQVVGSKGLVLGPDAIVPPQRVVLSLDDRRIEVGTDGLAAFAVLAEPTAEPAR